MNVEEYIVARVNALMHTDDTVIVKRLGLETWKGIKTTVRLAKKTMLDTITEYEYLPLSAGC